MSFLILVTYNSKQGAVSLDYDNEEWMIVTPVECGEEFDAYSIQGVIEAINKGVVPYDRGTDIIIRPV